MNHWPHYEWQGFTLSGVMQKGTIQAKNQALAKEALNTQGIVVQKLIKKHTPWLQRFKERITRQDITRICRQMMNLTQANIPLGTQLEVINKAETNFKIRALLTRIKQAIESGQTLAEACRTHPRYFEPLFCNLIEIGEQSAALSFSLKAITLHRERSELLRQTIQRALSYPIAILVLSLGITIALLIWVIPEFENLFISYNAELPSYTKMIISVSACMKNHGLWIVILTSISFYFIRISQQKIPRIAQALDSLVLWLPIVGALVHNALIVRFASTLQITLSAGISLIDALQSIENIMGNSRYVHAIQSVRKSVINGESMHIAMENTRVFNTMAIQMISIGEESGTLVEMLSHIVVFHQNTIDHTLAQLDKLLEPVILLILGLLLGGLIIAMYLPIYQLGLIM